MARKAPRRTADRILEAARDLFNRFGEPGVSTTAIAGQLGISPGNLYYHYPAKEEIVNALSLRHAQDLQALLRTAGGARDLPAAQAFLHALLGCLWDHRFLYRDTSDLLSRNRTLEAQFRQVVEDTTQALCAMLEALRDADALDIGAQDIPPAATNLGLVLAGWFELEFIRDPRQAQEAAQQVLERGTQQAMHLLAPYAARACSRQPPRDRG